MPVFELPRVQPPIEFETERLRLRCWRASDREPFAAMGTDPRVMEFFPARLDAKASREAIDRWQGLIRERGWGLWAAELKASGEFIGMVGLHAPAYELPFSPCVEVGWRLAHAHWGCGYATEGARGALRVGFERLGLDEIVSMTALVNRRSQAVMERLGMRRDAKTFEHPGVPVGHALREHCLYRLQRDEWRFS